jgi:hypothetical protein
MAAASFIPSLNLSMPCLVPKRFASSLRAEVWGILLSIAFFLHKSLIVVHNDSKNATDKYKKITSTKNIGQMLPCPCPYKWSLIGFLLKACNISLHLTWTKGHSNAINNNYVFFLATTEVSATFPRCCIPIIHNSLLDI